MLNKLGHYIFKRIFKDQEILVSIQGNYKSSINETINFDINNKKVLKFDQEGNRIYER